jgi:hypothetical protein
MAYAFGSATVLLVLIYVFLLNFGRSRPVKQQLTADIMTVRQTKPFLRLRMIDAAGEKGLNREENIIVDKTSHMAYGGPFVIPTRKIAGDSFKISIELRPTPQEWEGSDRVSVEVSKQGKTLRVEIDEISGIPKSLEIELQAAGFTVKGDERQRQTLKPWGTPEERTLSYNWNCCCEEASKKDISFIFSVVTGQDTKIYLGRVDSCINVVTIDHIPGRVLTICKTASLMLAPVRALLLILTSIHVL